MRGNSIKLLSEARPQVIGENEMIERNDAIRIVRLREQDYSIRQIAREMSISRNTVRKYLRSGGLVEYHGTNSRNGLLSGEEEWLRRKFFQHEGNADVIRQELLSERGLEVSLRTVERAVKGYREEVRRKKEATVRFETPPGFQMQIDFGDSIWSSLRL